MRLLNAETLEFEEFFRTNVPRYCIFSHRWTDEDVSYKDFIKGRNKKSKGYAKIKSLCTLARRQHKVIHSLGPPCYIWIDNCCIDKRSSAELSDAINSMFKYYAGSKLCYTYLQDIDANIPSSSAVASPELNDKFLAQVQKSEWFRRGWTLQELLAPKLVVLLNCRWEVIGHKCSEDCPCENHVNDLFRWVGPSLNEAISQITGIRQIYFERREKLFHASIARRMSWAAKRQTTRKEDEAYCLLGLFNINIPLLYGEGEMAFQRLQEELVKRSTDHSIFAWNANSRYRSVTLLAISSMLARSPA